MIKVTEHATMRIKGCRIENSEATLQRRILLTRVPPTLGPGSWGFEGPELMYQEVLTGGRSQVLEKQNE